MLDPCAAIVTAVQFETVELPSPSITLTRYSTVLPGARPESV
ncbi:Uncharacterised protein [Mycobacteroides abscessus]|nr:Uncharacterised protein [Mycobacteroides abscessus]